MNGALCLKRAPWYRQVSWMSPLLSPVCLLWFVLAQPISVPYLGLPHYHIEQDEYISGFSCWPLWLFDCLHLAVFVLSSALSILEKSSRQNCWFVIWASVSFAKGLAIYFSCKSVEENMRVNSFITGVLVSVSEFLGTDNLYLDFVEGPLFYTI